MLLAQQRALLLLLYHEQVLLQMVQTAVEAEDEPPRKRAKPTLWMRVRQYNFHCRENQF